MENLNEKQRKIIRLAYTSKDPDLRQKAIRVVQNSQRIVEARYTPEFKEWADAQGDVFTHPETKNKNKFNSIPSQAQSEVFRRWEAGEYEKQGGPAPGEKGDGGDGGGGGGDDAGAADDGGDDKEKGEGKYADRTELRGVARKSMDEKAQLKEKDLGDFLPVVKLERLPDDRGERLKKGLQNASYNDLESLQDVSRFLIANPDDEFSRKHWMREALKLTPAEIKMFHKGITKKLAEAKGRLYSENVLEIANDNVLEGIDADKVYQFRKDKPKQGRKLTPEQLKQMFLQGPWARDPKVRERVQAMNADEFMAMRNAIFEEEEEEMLDIGAGKVASSAAKAASSHEEGEEEEEFDLFMRPPGSEKSARLSKMGRRIVRIAYESKDRTVREKAMKLLVKHRTTAS